MAKEYVARVKSGRGKAYDVYRSTKGEVYVSWGGLTRIKGKRVKSAKEAANMAEVFLRDK